MKLKAVFVLIFMLFSFLSGTEHYCSGETISETKQDLAFVDKQDADVMAFFDSAAETQKAIQQNVNNIVSTQHVRVLSSMKRLVDANRFFNTLLFSVELSKAEGERYSFTLADFAFSKDYYVYLLRRIRI
jgi:hypothetical protein